jgi:glutamyl-tRNA synthetase
MPDSKRTRVRFAPSPTGYLHIGGARTALYNYLFARATGGTYILRIEDTDRTRSLEEMVGTILESMEWLGLTWDEGPYYQSERLELYREAAEKLIAEGLARYEDTEKGRAVRFKVKRERVLIDDVVHKKVEFDAKLIEDFIIMKSDGFPSYNFACVIDDNDMGITHVIRGDDHISNTPRQVLLYRALGLEPPRFAHLPMILGEDGARLSKRHGATSVMEYKEAGFLPDALLNFLALLGWSPGENVEILSMEEMCSEFSLEDVKSTAARFNTEKLTWMNAQYIKKRPQKQLLAEAKEFLVKEGIDLSQFPDGWLTRFLELVRDRLKTFKELSTLNRFFFADDVRIAPASAQKVLYKNSEAARAVLEGARTALSGLDDFSAARLEKALRELAGQLGMGFKKIAQPIRVSVTGTHVSPPLFGTLELLGKEKVLRRLEEASVMLSEERPAQS